MNKIDLSSPRDLGGTLVKLLRPKCTDKIYDGAFGSLGFLLEAKAYIDKHENNKITASNFYGREINDDLFTVAKEQARINGLSTAHLLNEDSLEASSQEKDKFDIVISCPPFSLRVADNAGELGIVTSDGVNKFIQHYISVLKEGGRAAIVVPNIFLFWSANGWAELRKYILFNCNLHAILDLPANTFSYTGLNTSVIFLDKGGSATSIKYFSKKQDEDYSQFIDFYKDNIFNDRSFVYPLDSICNDTCSLPTAAKLAIDLEIEEKTKNFNKFNLYESEDICLEINLPKNEFKEKLNAIYLPKSRNAADIVHTDTRTLRHKNYIQLVLDESKILNGYMLYYLKTSLGQLVLDRCYVASSASNHTSKRSLVENFDIYAPSLEEQKTIANTFETLAEVVSLIDKTANEHSSDPNSAKHILEKLFQTKEVFDALSMEEKIIKLIKGKENLKVEFKETLSRNIHTNKKDKDLQSSVLKNIVGFLNKAGGQLLIGIADSGEIKGIEKDFYKNDDAYKLLLSNLINDKIGTKESSYIKLNIHLVGSKKICLIECTKAPHPIYLDGDFYVRTDPECRKLSAKDANEYIKENFQIIR